jgi:hypothetical protein
MPGNQFWVVGGGNDRILKSKIVLCLLILALEFPFELIILAQAVQIQPFISLYGSDIDNRLESLQLSGSVLTLVLDIIAVQGHFFL